MAITCEVKASPSPSAALVACRYIGAHTLHTEENCEAWPSAMSVSSFWIARSELRLASVDTVGYT